MVVGGWPWQLVDFTGARPVRPVRLLSVCIYLPKERWAQFRRWSALC